MKVIIAGSRNITDLKIVEEAIAASMFDITEVVCGDCRGVDKLGEKWAKANGIPVKHFPAEWDNFDLETVTVKTNRWGKRYNAAAGFVRNSRMAEYADALIAIWDGQSPGTNNMIDEAGLHLLSMYIYRI